jgi:hypothetical protein
MTLCPPARSGVQGAKGRLAGRGIAQAAQAELFRVFDCEARKLGDTRAGGVSFTPYAALGAKP